MRRSTAPPLFYIFMYFQGVFTGAVICTDCFSHESADDASEDHGKKGSEKRYRHRLEGVFHFCAGEVDCRDVKDRFAGAHNDGGTSSEIRIGAVLIVYGLQYCKRSASGKGLDEYEGKQLFGNAQGREHRRRKSTQQICQSRSVHQFQYDEHSRDVCKKSEGERQGFGSAGSKSVVGVDLFYRRADKQKNDDGGKEYCRYVHYVRNSAAVFVSQAC